MAKSLFDKTYIGKMKLKNLTKKNLRIMTQIL